MTEWGDERLSHACLSTEIPELITVVSNKFHLELQNTTSCHLLPSLPRRQWQDEECELLLLIIGQRSCHDTIAFPIMSGFTNVLRIPGSAFPHNNKGSVVAATLLPSWVRQYWHCIHFGVCAQERENEHTVQFTLLGFHAETQGNVSRMTSAVT